MRKIGILVAAAAVLGSLGAYGGIFGGEVLAACGYGIQADDFYAPCGRGESDDGKIKVEQGKDGDADVTIITLNNYVGGAVYGASCGSYGFDSDYFVINLIGENRITEAEGVGVGLSQVKFVGEGTLTVSAMIPVGGGSLCDYCSATQGEVCRINWAGIDEDVLVHVLGVTTMTIAPANGAVVFGHEAASTDGTGVSGAGSSEKLPDDALIGPTEEQATGKKSAGEVTLWAVIATVALLAVAGIGFLLGRRTAKDLTPASQGQKATKSATRQVTKKK